MPSSPATPENRPVIITLDGPAGVGKSTLAKALAEKLGLPYLDTGAMFRSVAALLGEKAWEREDAQLAAVLNTLSFGLTGQGSQSCLYINGQPVDESIRQEKIGLWASRVGKREVVRTYLKEAQREIGLHVSLVAEGRDMGSVVFPFAQCKIFVDASAEERAKRRCKQLAAMGTNVDFQRLLADLRERDEQDRNRSIAPLRPADDAWIVDTTTLTLQQAMDRVIEVASRAAAEYRQEGSLVSWPMPLEAPP